MKQRILGIDPGSCITGFGVLEIDSLEPHRIICITGGCIRLSGETESEKLGGLLYHLDQLIKKYQPSQMAIEAIFLHKNAQSALKLGQARGVALAVARMNGLEVSPYAARQVKLAVAGSGSAEKIQVQYMVSNLLNIQAKIQADAADALAIALCHAYVQMNWRLNNAMIDGTAGVGQKNKTIFSRKRTARKRNYKWPSYQNNK